MKKKKLIKWLGLMLGACIGIVAFCYVQNNVIGVTSIAIESSKIEQPINIVHLSDLHDKQFGKDNARLVEKVRLQEPDIIMFTGDLIDKKTQDITNMVNTLNKLNGLAQVYYIPGNHEYWSGKSEVLFQKLREADVKVLDNEEEDILVQGQKISILGIAESYHNTKSIETKLKEFEKSENFKVVLSHYPENFLKIYSRYDVDLVLAGHAHGGQFHIPWIGGVYAPGQGFFPEYYKGIYTENGVHLVVSRGLGNSVIPFRVFNRPEIVAIQLG